MAQARMDAKKTFIAGEWMKANASQLHGKSNRVIAGLTAAAVEFGVSQECVSKLRDACGIDPYHNPPSMRLGERVARLEAQLEGLAAAVNDLRDYLAPKQPPAYTHSNGAAALPK